MIDYRFVTDCVNETVTITGYNGLGGGDIFVPDTIGNWPVVAIKDGAFGFYYCNNLTSISLPASVTSIGKYAFGNCSEAHVAITIRDKKEVSR